MLKIGKKLVSCFRLILDDKVLAIYWGQFYRHILMCVCMIEYVCVSKNQMFDRLSNLSVFLQGKVEFEGSQATIKNVVKCYKISAMYHAAILCPRAEPCHKSFTMLSVL